jgi:hypothetical protein
MTHSIATSLQRLDLYLDRVWRDLESGDRSQALSDCAELSEIARRLWCYLAHVEGFSATEAQLKLSGGGEN